MTPNYYYYYYNNKKERKNLNQMACILIRLPLLFARGKGMGLHYRTSRERTARTQDHAAAGDARSVHFTLESL